MNSIHLQQTLPQVFADRNSVTSDVWHQDLIFRKEEMYLIEASTAFPLTITATRFLFTFNKPSISSF